MNKKYLKQAAKIALKSGCIRAKRGTILVRDDQVLAKAFNSPYPTNDFCQEHGCLRDKLKLGMGKEAEKCRSIHAEAKAIALAAQKGCSLKGATAYITGMSCINCSKLIIASGIKEVYYLDVHADRTGTVLMERMGIKVERGELEGDRPEERLRDMSGQRK